MAASLLKASGPDPLKDYAPISMLGTFDLGLFAGAGIDALVMPYKGSPALLTALRAGEVDIEVEIVGPMLPQLQAGVVRALAVTGVQRHPLLPDVPTLAQAGVAGMQVTSWNALAAPAGTSAELQALLAAEMQRWAAVVRATKIEPESGRVGPSKAVPAGGHPDAQSPQGMDQFSAMNAPSGARPACTCAPAGCTRQCAKPSASRADATTSLQRWRRASTRVWPT